MASGITPDDECLLAFQELKQNRKFKYIIFGLGEDLTNIVVLTTSQSEDYEDFIQELPASECRWAVYDVAYEKEGGRRNKLCFISWSPESAKIKEKMVHASSKGALRRLFDGVSVEIQGTEYDEISYEAVLDKVSRGS